MDTQLLRGQRMQVEIAKNWYLTCDMHDRVVYLATTYRRPAVNIHDLWIWKRKMKYLFLYIVRENIRQGNKEMYVDQVSFH